MPDRLTVSAAARELSEKLCQDVKPRDISNLFYSRELRDDLCPVVCGRRIIPQDYLPLIEAALLRRGFIRKQREGKTHA